MKYSSLLTLMIALFAFANAINAKPVDEQSARMVGVKFLNANTKMTLRGSSDLELVKTYNTESGIAAFYVFNVPNGYVIVSADDCAHPILGYSEEGQFNVDEDAPVNMKEYFDGYVEQIAYGIENQIVDPEITRQWRLVKKTGHVTEHRAITVVEPLLTDTWGQTSPYNIFCPYDENYKVHTVVGCVATSMGQIMRYWGYPAYGTGSMTYQTHYPEQSVNFAETAYDWANMPDAVNNYSDSTQIKAVATLLWHCGVSITIEYGTGATAGNSADVAEALVNYFYYSPELYGVYKYNYTDDEWLNMVKSCLDLARPIHYSGGNHAFVCDGYDANNYLHFNWGWHGSYNGYYQLGALNPGGDNFSNYNYAIFDIHPDCSQEANYDVTVTPNLSEGGTVSGAGSYSCGDGCSLVATPANGYRFCSWTENDEIVSTEPTYNITVTRNRDLTANFIEENGDYCTLVFYLYDSYLQNYGNGWNGNNLIVNYSDGCILSENMTILGGNSTIITRSVPDGTHIELGWISGESVGECYFSVSYEDGPMICQGYNLSNDYFYEFDVDCDGSNPRYYAISTTANPTNAGVVSEGGSYVEGAECTINATPNDGYTFVNWTCIGEVLSTDAAYSFTVTKNMNIIANFVKSNTNIVGGALPGTFSVSDSIKVNFAQGNLQYIGCVDNPYWKFAEHQWDFLGTEGNGNMGLESYKSNRDLFGWGCSGYNHGSYPYINNYLMPYQPWTTIENTNWYGAYGDALCDLNARTGEADWGYNAIINGGNCEGQWRTLTNDEWSYLLDERHTSSNKRYAKAQVNNINGLILLPDDWNPDYYNLDGYNSVTMSFNINIISSSDWMDNLEAHGAVFLPAAGWRAYGSTIRDVGNTGCYWSSTHLSNSAAYNLFIQDFTCYYNDWYGMRFNGKSVRLVRSTQNDSIVIKAITNPGEGGSIIGAGTYLKDQYCILKAIANEEYRFVGWVENGKMVSTNPNYTFKVVKGRDLFANFVYEVYGEGILQGAFSVSDSSQVHFSQGNLQFQASNNLWRFAGNQWDYVGGTSYGTVYENGVKCSNTQISSSYSGWIDLFGWGTSGYDHGSVCYQPWSISVDNNDYLAYGEGLANLYDQTGQADWGYNNISNGGNATNIWRTLSYDEWKYVLTARNTTSGIRFAKARVNDVNGIIILPDDWDSNYYDLNNPNLFYSSTSTYSDNQMSSLEWTNTLEAHGAVFIPAANQRTGTNCSADNSWSYYWTSSNVDYNNNIEKAWAMYFQDTYIGGTAPNKYNGCAVRLICSVHSITALPNLLEGGSVSGCGLYASGTECTLTATANNNYTFVNWTLNGEVVSTNPIYTFTVTENSFLVANFYGSNCMINATSNMEEGGDVTGTGSYLQGQTCVLTATANEGYYFVDWEENNEVVSTDATYSFMVMESRNLIANFKASNVNKDGVLYGVFSVNANQQVHFAQGNLQYQATTNTWRFADNQYDYLGKANKQISSTNDGWIDLFGWGTSGYDHGAVCYQPWSTSLNCSDYLAYGDGFANLCNQTGQADWGYNAISNGGNHINKWHTLSYDEWVYLLRTRNTSSGVRFAKAQVNCINGLILLPDDWSNDYFSFNNPNPYYGMSSFCDNQIDLNTWKDNIEAHGAVFLPAANTRFGSNLAVNNDYGYYWTSTTYNYNNKSAYDLFFKDTNMSLSAMEKYQGCSVRLVCTAHTITTMADPIEGGLVNGGGLYIEGTECTISAEGDDDHIFLNWTKDGEVVTTSPTYTFTVTESQNYVAHFAVDDRPKQTTSLGTGWNWYSTYLEIGNGSGLEMLENSLGEHCEMICSQTAFTTYYPTYGWYGSLTNMVNEKMYRLKMTSPTSITMRGALANPIDHPITMVEGWNHIGFLSSISLSVADAFSGFQPMDGDMVKNQATFARYYDGYGWYGSLNTVDPGDGLMYKSVNGESVTFTYPQGSRESTMENLTAENDHWVPDMCHYRDNMTMIAVVELDGQEIVSEKYEVAAFANGECRGSVRLSFVEPLKRYVAFLTMGGEDGDEVVFRLYSREDDQALGVFAEECVRFTVDEAIGSGYEPKVLHFNREELGFELPECELFPNPTDGRVIVRSDNSITMITVTDALGQVVYRTTVNSNETKMNLGHFKAGIYLVHIETSKGVVVKKLSLK